MHNSFVYRGLPNHQDAVEILSRDWLVQQLRCVNEATIITAYWDGRFIRDLLSEDVGKLRKLRVIVQSRDYFGKKTLLRNDFVGAEDLRRVGSVNCEVLLIDSREGIFHVKTFVFGTIDAPQAIWIGSANATRNAFEKNTDVLVCTAPDAVQGLIEWVIEMIEASSTAENQRGSSIEHLLMAGYIWVDSPKTQRNFGVPMSHIKEFQIPNIEPTDTPGSLEHKDESYTMSVPRVIRLCDDQRAREVAEAFVQTGILSGTKSERSSTFQWTPSTIWTPLGRWATPKANRHLETKNDDVPLGDESAWAVIVNHLEDVLQSTEYKAIKSKQIQDIASYGSLSKAGAITLDEKFTGAQNRFKEICQSPKKRRKLTRLLENRRVPNLCALGVSDPEYVDWIIDEWVGSLLERGCGDKKYAEKKFVDAFDLTDDWKILHVKWIESDADSAKEITHQAKELIAMAWARCNCSLPDKLCEDEQVIVTEDICRSLGIEGWIESDSWKRSFKQLLSKVHQSPRNSDFLITERVDIWQKGLGILITHGINIRHGAWCVPKWPLSHEDLAWWLDEPTWEGWVWCSGVPIYDPPHAFGDECNGGCRLSKEDYEDEGLLPPWKADDVDYSVLGGADLRLEIPSLLDSYRKSKGLDSDIKKVEKWVSKSSLKNENAAYQQMKDVGYKRMNNEHCALWRRRITADERGKLTVAPLGKSYMNLWGEPCCCGRPVERCARDGGDVFKKCRLCQSDPNL